MRRWHWVRHAPTGSGVLAGWHDVPADLSDLPALTALSKSLPQDAVMVSSDLARARSTMDAIKGGRRCLEPHPGLRELHYGRWEGQTIAQITATDPERSRAFWTNPEETHPPGGEDWQTLVARVSAAIADLSRSLPQGPVVVVSHHGPILAALQIATGQSTESALRFKLDHLGTTTMTELDPPHGWRVDAVNVRVSD